MDDGIIEGTVLEDIAKASSKHLPHVPQDFFKLEDASVSHHAHYAVFLQGYNAWRDPQGDFDSRALGVGFMFFNYFRDKPESPYCPKMKLALSEVLGDLFL